jgi:hypothetical protein
VSEVSVVRIADASHWIQNDVPERANALWLEFPAWSAPLTFRAPVGYFLLSRLIVLTPLLASW